MPLQLNATQRICLFGFLNPRPYLHWSHFVNGDVTIDACIAAKLPSVDLYEKVQSSLDEWLALPDDLRPNKTHILYMEPWGLHPIVHLNCSFEDIIFMRLPVDTMLKLNLGFETLYRTFYLDADVLRLFRYKWSDWVRLGISKMFVMELGRTNIETIFGITYIHALNTSLQ